MSGRLVSQAALSTIGASNRPLGESDADRVDVTRVEIVDAGEDAAVLCVTGPRFVEQAGTRLNGQISIRFTVRGGLIVRMDDFLTREEALGAGS